MTTARCAVALLAMLSTAGGCWNASVSEKPPVASTPVPPMRPMGGVNLPPPLPPPDAPSAAFFLDSSWGIYVQSSKRNDPGLLSRELLRQALLIAAREELGLTTRDELLGDAPPSEKTVLPFSLACRDGSPARLVLRRGAGANGREIGDMELTRHDAPDYYKKHAASAERLSRAEMVEILKRSRSPGKPRPWNAGFAVPAPIEDLLAEMVCFAQFDAVRQLHQLAAAQGESPAVLGALVRGYAHLGILTEHHWSVAHKVFKARSLLYAQRWTAREPKSLSAQWHRAYALTLLGAHAEATGDLQAVDKAWQARPANARPPRPEWVDLLDACIHYDLAKLAAATDHPKLGSLATLLHFQTIDLCGDTRWALQAGGKTLARLPECYRVHDAVYRHGGVSVRHLATIAPATVLGRTLYGRVRKMPGLPEAARREADARPAAHSKQNAADEDDDSGGLKDEFNARARLIAALRTAPDVPGEPSWTALGDLIRELSFVHVWQRTHFLSRSLSVSPDAFLKTAEPLVAGHPYHVGLEALSWTPSQSQPAMQRLVTMVPPALQHHFDRMFEPVDYRLNPGFKPRSTKACRNGDDLAQDYVMYLRNTVTDQEGIKELNREMLAVSPHSPFARAHLASIGAATREEIAEWEKRAGDYPALATGFAERYSADKQYDRAIAMCEAALKTDPENLDAHKLLAAAWLEKGDQERWLKTLEAALRLPDFGLDHAQIQNGIAQHFMGKGEWTRALPYARGAAGSYSGWGLHCLAECYEGMGDVVKAESLILAAAERYRNGAPAWYYFCRRTGRGDLAAARKAAQDYINSPDVAETIEQRMELINFYFLEKQHDKLLAIYRDAFAVKALPSFLVWIAVVADETNKPAQRDEALQQAKPGGPLHPSTEKDPESKAILQLAEWMRRDVAQNRRGAVSRTEIEKWRAGIPPAIERARFDMLLARCLQVRGNREDAAYYYRQALGPVTPHSGIYTFAAGMLRDMGLAPNSPPKPTEKQPAGGKK